MTAHHAPNFAPTASRSSCADDAASLGAPLVGWLVAHALPRWSTTGVDFVDGGFFEKIDLQGHAVEEPRRARVVARQIYVFATAEQRGWLEGADRLVDHGLNFLRHRLTLPDGMIAAAVQADGTLVDGGFDLYEHAFVLFALATARRGRPDRDVLTGEALGLLQRMRAGWRHPHGGFEESVPTSLPLKSNPHMHLLEAALAWVEATTGPAKAVWQDLAQELVDLCLTRFIDEKGALHEYFDADWRPMPGPAGRRVEPGHQFEWAWLLMRSHNLAAPDRLHEASRRLLEIGEVHGVDPHRGVAINAIDQDRQVVDAAAKLWPQTERIKAWQLASRTASDALQAETAQRSLADAIGGLTRYLLDSPRGLWHEVLGADGQFQQQDCRASSLYHIVCAIDALDGRVDDDDDGR